jgi:mono/diheme cytochrome c family protein
MDGSPVHAVHYWKPMRKLILVILLVLAVGALVALVLFPRDGFSARGNPSAIETFAAKSARQLSIPKSAAEMKNPVPDTPEVLHSAMLHFADHCAVCHANDGSGHTEMGRNMYPKVPDMRKSDTQKLSDGELYYIIENGIRLTGMPAWGKGGNDDQETWALVRFIRHLPQLTNAEQRQMRAANPMTEEERQEEKEEEEFLNGTDTQDTKQDTHKQDSQKGRKH